MPYRDAEQRRVYHREYMRKQRALQPPKRMGHPPNKPEDVWLHIHKGEGCWEWELGLSQRGYGKWKIDGLTVLVHRVVWVLTYGPIPDETPFVCHNCDNPKCARPTHLFLGTHGDNMADMVSKERQARGSRQGGAKLTVQDVLEMRDLYATGSWTHKELAIRYEVSRSLAGQVVNKTGWSWL